MPREHRILLYRFSELSRKAKDAAMKKWIEDGHAWGSFENASLTDYFKEMLKEAGFEDPIEVSWSLNYDQGDGVVFKGAVDLERFLRANDLTEYDRLVGHVFVRFDHTGHDTHWNSIRDFISEEMVEVRRKDPKDWRPARTEPPSREYMMQFEKAVKGAVKALSKKLQKIGYKEIEYRQSEEVIADTFEANDYEFTEDGKMFHG